MFLKSKLLRKSALSLFVVASCIIALKVTADTSHNDKFQSVAQPINVSSGDKIEVAELFWFGCGGCYALEPDLKQWLKNKPDNIEFKKIPAIFSKRWEFHGRAFYTMQALDVPQKAYDDFFNKIHVEGKGMNTLNALIGFLKDYGKTEEQITSAFNSFDVDSKVRLASKISRQSGSTAVPAIIVDGKYLTSPGMAGSAPEMFKVVEQLADKAESERK